MKSKYAPLVKLKKKSLDNTERSLISANNELSSASTKLHHAYEDLSRMMLPTQGSIGEFTQAAAIIHAQHLTIEECKNRLQLAEQKQVQARERFKQAMIDYEKFKYLEVQEMNEHLKLLKAQEDKMLDEIGTITYKREIL
ncbi:flagellar FliJ family protein [Sulfuricurvum sp.]|uniref:flagellar FliJ family protein n=1 Tax=Sulfuricurvum sp. TaxID=2025608 RepID=UPI003BB0A6E4